MPPRSTRKDGFQTVRIGQTPDGTGGLGSLGVDLQTHPSALSDFALRRGERVRVQDQALSRAPGAKRLQVFTDNTAARTFNDVGKYATMPALVAGSALFVPAGGFGFRLSFIATRPPTGPAFAWSLKPASAVTYIYRVSLASTGVLTVSWRDTAGTTHTVATSAIDDGATVHLLAVYDAVLGTYTVYIDGTSVGTPETGLAATLKPWAAIGTVGVFGVEKETGAAVTANSQFVGAIDAFTLFTFSGIRIASGSPALLDTLRKHTFRQWPNPALPYVLCHYDFDEASGSVLYDRSRHKNHGAYTGASTSGASVALAFPVGNYVGTFQGADGRRTNLFAAGGNLQYELIRAGS
ncbi:MAG: LamG domain-containing protein [Actinobacteria bacterium]|nr:LamG domain-containing protein [Actinomycetota bacterium]